MTRKILAVLGIAIILTAMVLGSGIRDVRQAVSLCTGETKPDISEYPYAVRMVTGQESVLLDNTTVNVQIYAVAGNENDIYPRLLQSGRWFYPEELERGTKGCVIEEPLAIALFHSGDVTGKEITLNGENWRILGVTREADTLGRSCEHRVYVPFQSWGKSGDYIVYSAGDFVNESGELKDPGGTKYSLKKEKARIALLPRLMLGLLIILFLDKLRRVLVEVGKYLTGVRKEKRIHYYPREMRGWTVTRFGGLILGWVIWLGTMALVLTILLEPVTIFPEWIPDVLVEPESIGKTITGILREPEDVLLQTQEVRKLHFYASLANLGTTVTLISMLAPGRLLNLDGLRRKTSRKRRLDIGDE